MIKRTKNNPNPRVTYAESMLYAIAILELILWHKYENKREKKNETFLHWSSPLIITKNKITNGEIIKHEMTIFIQEQKKLKKLHYGD